MKKSELIENIKNKQHLILAIDGMSASGKSTLANELHQLLGGNLFHLDDFFLPLEKRTKERLEEPGGNVDYERFLEEVLIPISKQETVYYRRFDCSTMTLQKASVINYSSINIIEGSYAMHPIFTKYYTDCVVLYVSPQTQLQRLKVRSPNQLDMFVHRWIPLENQYFKYYQIYQKYPYIKMD